MFTFKVARPQQLDSFSYLFSPLLLSFALPAPLLANRKTLQVFILSRLCCEGLLKARRWPFFVSGASQSSEQASALRVCTPLHSGGSRSHSYGSAREGPAPVNLRTSSSKLPSTGQTGLILPRAAGTKKKKIQQCSSYLLCRLHVQSKHGSKLKLQPKNPLSYLADFEYALLAASA